MPSATRILPLLSLAFTFSGLLHAQEAPESNRKIAGGGISVPGWQGEIDPSAKRAGESVSNAKLSGDNDTLQITTGPAITYWDPKNVAKGDYTVSATFTEPKFMNLNSHPHPYGLVIAGNDLGTAQASYLYCAAYGDGYFIVRGFGPEPFQLNGRREANDAVHKAAGVGSPITQDIAIQVKSGTVSCIINGTVVKTLQKADLVSAGKLKSTDGIYGLRFAHNTDATVTGLKLTH